MTLQENDVWMLGSALEKIINCTRPNPESNVGKEMCELVQKIKSLELRSADALLNHPWLAAHTPEDLDELRMATLYLFTPRPESLALPSAATASRRGHLPKAAATAVAEQFEADLNFVNTRRGNWRVFRVGDAVARETQLAVGDVITEVDGSSPDGWQQRTGVFYSEMRLAVRGKGLITVRRTRAVQPEVAERVVPDWERFRQHLFASLIPWPASGTFPRQQLLANFIRSAIIPVAVVFETCRPRAWQVQSIHARPHTKLSEIRN
jgi:hypothetical protein